MHFNLKPLPGELSQAQRGITAGLTEDNRVLFRKCAFILEWATYTQHVFFEPSAIFVNI